MKKVNFNHSGGFPLEQETLERLQAADKSELYEALKAHLSLDIAFNYILASPKNGTKGLAIIHQNEKDSQGKVERRGILYPINPGTDAGYLKTTRNGTNLVYGDGTSQTAYFDYEAQYIGQTEYDTADKSGTNNTESSTVYYYELKNFRKVMDLATLEAILAGLDNSVKANTKAIGENATAIGEIKQNYLPRDGSKSMTGNLTVDGKLYLNNTNSANSDGSILVLDSSNQVIKGNSLINPLLNSVTDLVNRVIELEKKQKSAIPEGMIAIWGKPAPFPEGWIEYVGLRGRMPFGLNPNDSEFSQLGHSGGEKNKKLTIDELPKISPVNGRAFRKGGSWGSNKGVTIGDYDGGDFLDGELIKPFGGDQEFSLMNPYKIVHFIQYVGLSGDTTKPTSPTNLKVSDIASTSLTLSWTAATDNVAIDKYLVSVNNGTAVPVNGNLLSYNVIGLSPGTLYSFKVFAQDAAGNVSNPSLTINESTALLIEKPSYITCYSSGENKITIEWDLPPRSSGASYYEVWRRTAGGTSALIATSSNLSYLDTGSYDTTYFYKVRAVNSSGNVSDFTIEESATTEPRVISCFDVESLVTMASGQSKKLKNIVVGDKLQGFSFPNEIDESEGDYFLWNGKLNEAVKAEVTVVNKRTSIQPDYYEIKAADVVIKATGEHPILITEDGENLKWVSTKNVLQNMSLVDKLGKTKPVESILFKEEPLEVALLDVEEVDNYVISGIVVHNSKPADPR
ncbi:fibronectin type III domain-containing protein [Flavobacterium sp. T12S277]|uniref:fibronectin type III domain-containing protein n=1 Tax=Flavobacterium sp. T12S277 TaxID=3402752 RepID=UPI003ADE2E19